jgi:hypothetical protein
MIQTVKYLDIQDSKLPKMYYHFLWAYFNHFECNDLCHRLPLDLYEWDELHDEDAYNSWETIREKYNERIGSGSSAMTVEEVFEHFKEWTKSQGAEFTYGSHEIFLVKLWW